jgi:predicted nucleotidyltransferase component of viral defense system
MKLHQNRQLFQDAVVAAAQYFNIPEIYIEKDYWITVALYEIFHNAIGKEVIFKGGTALSKAHKLVERFSEDVDLVILRKVGESNNQLKNKLKAISTIVGRVMPEIALDGITNKMGQIRKTAHEYPKAGFKGIYGQVRENIIIESTWLGNHEPYADKMIDCYITGLMIARGQEKLIEEYNLTPFVIKVLAKERTFCEKIMSLVRFSQTENPYADLANKVRHIYDIHLMLKDREIQNFFDSSDFDKMLTQVGKDDVSSFKNNNAWLANHPVNALIFSETDKVWSKIRNGYNNEFKGLVIGVFPDEKEIIATLKLVSTRLNKIHWGITVSNTMSSK